MNSNKVKIQYSRKVERNWFVLHNFTVYGNLVKFYMKEGVSAVSSYNTLDIQQSELNIMTLRFTEKYRYIKIIKIYKFNIKDFYMFINP